MRGINRALVLGHLGRDPESRTTPGGRTVATFSVATNHSTKRGDEWVEATDWHTVEAWESQADTAMRFLARGTVVCIEGRMQTDSWEDKDSGKKVFKTKIVCEKLHLVDRTRLAEVSGVASEGGDPPAGALTTRGQPEAEVPF